MMHQSSLTLIKKQLVLVLAKVGVGIAVVVFGLVFALGDFLPTGSETPTQNTAVVKNKISEEEKATFQAVNFLLDTRERLNTRKTSTSDSVTSDTEPNLDPIQVELLLGKAYSDWGHVSDAIAVYDQLITDHPEDFRGYLAKGILLKENGSRGDAERMFIQARFFAPDKAKAFVDRYSKQ